MRYSLLNAGSESWRLKLVRIISYYIQISDVFARSTRRRKNNDGRLVSWSSASDANNFGGLYPLSPKYFRIGFTLSLYSEEILIGWDVLT